MIADLLSRLRVFYGPLPVPPRDPFAVYAWEVMGFHAPPLKREAALAALRRIPALTPDAVWKAPLGKIEAAAVLAGAHGDERVRALRAGADVFRRNPDLPHRLRGSLLGARRALRILPPLGEGRLHRFLLFAAGHPIVPVDQPVARVIARLGLVGDIPEARRLVRAVRRALSREVPVDLEARRHASIYLEHHGLSTCLEHDPHCSVCPLLADCPHGRSR